MSISEVRVQTKPGQWMIHILDTCNHACHIPAYRCYVQRLVQQHVPFPDCVCVEDIHIQELCIALRIQVLASSQTKNQLEAACRDYIQDCRVQRQDLYAPDLLQELRKSSAAEIIHCCFQRIMIMKAALSGCCFISFKGCCHSTGHIGNHWR
ncbi:MAG: hypothetical protein ACLT16_11345 [[Clostridium] innocuum]